MKKTERYVLTEFYCEKCKVWHRATDKQFLKCLDRYEAHFSFKGYREAK